MKNLLPILALFSILLYSCGSGTAETKKRLLGNWTDGTHRAEFSDKGEVYLEQRTASQTVGKRFKYTVESSTADITGAGTATLLEDGRLHLKVTFGNPSPLRPSDTVSANVDAYLRKE